MSKKDLAVVNDKYIPYEKWSILPAGQQTFLTRLGFELGPEKKKTVKMARKELVKAYAPDPHLLEVNVHCTLCGSKTKEYFDMRRSSNALRSDRLSFEHFAHLQYEVKKRVETAHERTHLCCMCNEVFEQKPKSELIRLLKRAHVLQKTGRAL